MQDPLYLQQEEHSCKILYENQEECSGSEVGRVLDLRSRGYKFEPHWRRCVVSLSKTYKPLLKDSNTSNWILYASYFSVGDYGSLIVGVEECVENL